MHELPWMEPPCYPKKQPMLTQNGTTENNWSNRNSQQVFVEKCCCERHDTHLSCAKVSGNIT